jgi:hypothetical protein
MPAAQAQPRALAEQRQEARVEAARPVVAAGAAVIPAAARTVPAAAEAVETSALGPRTSRPLLVLTTFRAPPGLPETSQ